MLRALNGDEGDARIVRGELALLGLLMLPSAGGDAVTASASSSGETSLVRLRDILFAALMHKPPHPIHANV